MDKLKYFLYNNFFYLIKYLPGYFRRKIRKKLELSMFHEICFVPTKYDFLPKDNHPILIYLKDQIRNIEEFQKTQKETTSKTYPNLINLLKKIYSENDTFNFLDFGGDRIDQYLILKKNFINIKYFIANKEEINNNFLEIKQMYGYKDLNVIRNINEIDKHNFDFVNFGSVLQYIDTYEILLDKILSKTKKYVLVSGAHFYNTGNKKKNFVVKQVNILPKILYLYFFNLSDFIEKFKKYEFKIQTNEKNSTHDINYENFARLNIPDLRYSDIFFVKKS